MAKWSFSVHGVTCIITSNIYTRLAACNCISITFWSGDLPSPLMAIFMLGIFLCFIVVCRFFSFQDIQIRPDVLSYLV